MTEFFNHCSRGLVRSALSSAAFGLVLAFFTVHARDQQTRPFSVEGYGVVPRPAVHGSLLATEAVQAELKMTAAQKQELLAIRSAATEKLVQRRQEIKEISRFLTAQSTIFREMSAAMLANLTPEQRERLDQIQLQAQGPLAFARPDAGPFGFVSPSIPQRLNLTDDQMRRASTIFKAHEKDIEKAASFRVPLEGENRPPTIEAIRNLVGSPAFHEAKQTARKAARDATKAVTRRYRADSRPRNSAWPITSFWGSRSTFPGCRSARREWTNRRATSEWRKMRLGLGTGQRSDPRYKTMVGTPAYAGASGHPRAFRRSPP